MSQPPAKSMIINGNLFLCGVDGLKVEGFERFDLNVARFLPLATPKLTKKGTVAVHQPKVHKQSANYWRAQCVFRGLPTKGNIKVLQDRIREAGDLPMTPEIAAAEVRVKKAYQLYKDSQWKTLPQSQKIFESPERFLMEELLDENLDFKHQEAVVFKTRNRSSLHNAAQNLGLTSESTGAPYLEDGSKPDPSRWIVIAKTRSTVLNKILQIAREFSRSAQRAEEIREKQTRKLNKQVVAKALKSVKKGGWDVTGHWKIRCEQLEDYDSQGPDEFTIDIFSEISYEGKEIWGIFDFGIITGVMRFMGQKGTGKTVVTGSSKRKRAEYEDNEDDGEESEESEDEDEETDESEEEEDDPAFILPKSATPSPKTPKWNYRWRGEETGEGEIQLYSDQDVLSITFGGIAGTKLKGIFRCEYISGDIEFSGTKVGESECDGGESASGEWSERSEAAHERARVGRWR